MRATLGLNNHWYPALFGSELLEGELKGIETAGVPIFIRYFRECGQDPDLDRGGDATCWLPASRSGLPGHLTL